MVAPFFPSVTSSGGGGQYPFDAIYPPLGYANGTVSASTLYLQLTRVSKPITIVYMSLLVNTAAGNVDLGYYSDDDGDGTYVLEGRTGDTTAVGAGAEQKIALTTPLTLVPGRNYWRALIASSGSLSIHRATGASAISTFYPVFMSASVTYGTRPGLPTSFGSAAAQATVPLIVGKIS